MCGSDFLHSFAGSISLSNNVSIHRDSSRNVFQSDSAERTFNSNLGDVKESYVVNYGYFRGRKMLTASIVAYLIMLFGEIVYTTDVIILTSL